MTDIVWNPNGYDPAVRPEATHVVFKDGKRYLRDPDGSETLVHDEDLPKFLSAANVTEIEGTISTLMAKYSQLRDISSYEVKVLEPGVTQITLSNVDEELPVLFTLTNKTSSMMYFDFCLYSANHRECKCTSFNKKTALDGIVHSGDIGNLLHYVKMNPTQCTENNFYLSAVGYNQTPLKYFVVQQPSVVVADHSERVLYIVPCPLDEATIHDSCIVHLAHCNVENNVVTVTVLPQPAIQRDTRARRANTGDTGENIVKTLKDANDLYQTALQTLATHASEPHPLPVQTQPTMASSLPSKEVGPIACFIENCVPLPSQLTTLRGEFIAFGHGYGRTEPRKSDYLLPHAFGYTFGGQTSAVGQESAFSVLFTDRLQGAVIVVSDKWLDVNARTVQWTANNCIVIIVTTNPDLAQLNINGSCMAGPFSTILVSRNNELFWYRGAMGESFSFGENVTSYFTEEWFATWAKKRHRGLEIIQPTGSQTLWFEGKNLFVDVVQEELISTPIESWMNQDFQTDVQCLMIQLSIALDNVQMKRFTDALVVALETKKNALLTDKADSLKREMQAMIRSGINDSNQSVFKELANKIRSTKRMVHQYLNPVVEQLTSLTSVRGVSTQKQSLARAARKAQIAGNVANVSNMSTDDKLAYFEEVELLFMMTIEEETLPYFMAQIEASGGFSQWMSTNPFFTAAFKLHDRGYELDGSTVGALMEVCGEMSIHHVAQGSNGVALPLASTGKSQVPIPIPKAEDMTSGGDKNWAEFCNNPFYSTFRIMFREVLSSCASGRENHVASSSKELGFFIVWLFLHNAGQIADSLSALPSNPSDTTVVFIRGLTSWALSTMASTQSTLTPLYKLWMVDPVGIVPREHHWWILTMLQKVAPYTLWDTERFNANVRKLVVTHIHSAVVGPALAALNVATSTVEDMKTKDWIEFTNLAVSYVWWCAQTGRTPSSNRLDALMKKMKVTPSEGTERLTNHPRALRVAVCSYIKWSGNIPNDSKKQLKAQCWVDTERGGIAEGDPELLSKLTAIMAPYGGIKNEWVSCGNTYNEAELWYLKDQSQSEEATTTTSNVVAKKELSVREKLALQPGSSKALAIYDNLLLYKPGYGGLSNQLGRVLEGLNVANSEEAIPRIIEAMLTCPSRSSESVIAAGQAALF